MVHSVSGAYDSLLGFEFEPHVRCEEYLKNKKIKNYKIVLTKKENGKYVK